MVLNSCGKPVRFQLMPHQQALTCTRSCCQSISLAEALSGVKVRPLHPSSLQLAGGRYFPSSNLTLVRHPHFEHVKESSMTMGLTGDARTTVALMVTSFPVASRQPKFTRGSAVDIAGSLEKRRTAWLRLKGFNKRHKSQADVQTRIKVQL